MVAFVGETSNGTGMYRWNNGSLTTIVPDGNDQFAAFGTPSINDAGVVAFIGVDDSSAFGAYSGSGGALNTIVASNGLATPFDRPAINNSNAVAYVAEDFSIGGAGIFVRDGGSTTTVANASGKFRYFTRPQINNAGDVAFTADHDAINTTGVYFRSKGGPLVTIVEGFSAFTVSAYPSINDAGTVAFVRASQQHGVGVFTWNQGNLENVVDTLGPYYRFGDAVDINNEGTLVFQAYLDNYKFGIYSGADPLADKVVEIGDVMFGRTVSYLSSIPQINDRGDILFTYRLDDSTFGIALARAIPEPSGLLAASLSLGAIACSRFSRR